MDFSRALTTLHNMLDGLIAGLPNFGVALVIFLCFYLVGRRIRLTVIVLTEKRNKAKNLGVILGRLAQIAVILTGLLVVLAILFPSFNPGDLIQLLGIGSVAIGFAFHDLFQNFLAGILLLLTAPFRIGDQIVVQQYEGTVEDIAMRATTIRTYDGRRVVIPNTDLFTNSVTVNTAFSSRQLEYEIAISFDEDIARIKDMILDTLSTTEGVLKQPSAEVLVVGLGDSSVTLRISWWTNMNGHPSILHLQDKVLTSLKSQLTEQRVSLPTQSQNIFLQPIPQSDQEKATSVVENLVLAADEKTA